MTSSFRSCRSQELTANALRTFRGNHCLVPQLEDGCFVDVLVTVTVVGAGVTVSVICDSDTEVVDTVIVVGATIGVGATIVVGATIGVLDGSGWTRDGAPHVATANNAADSTNAPPNTAATRLLAEPGVPRVGVDFGGADLFDMVHFLVSR